MGKPFISVIVTAYNRKQFLLEALKSVVNQTLSRDKYEVIVTKNFEDKEIDDYIKINNIINFSKEDFWNEPRNVLEKTNGEVITFLDDDDLYSKDRLERIYKVFKKLDIGYYCNNVTHDTNVQNSLHKLGLKNENNYRIISYPYPNKLEYQNEGAVAVKRETLISHINEFRMLFPASDLFIFVFGLMSKKKIFVDFNKLTFLRVYGRGKTIEEYIKFKTEEIKVHLRAQALADKYNLKPAKRVIKRAEFSSIVILDILQKVGRNRIFRDLLRFPLKDISNRWIRNRFILLLTYFIFPKYGYKLILQKHNYLRN